MTLTLTTRGSLEVDVNGQSIVMSREQLVAGLALARDQRAVSRAWELLDHYDAQCDVCGELGCYIVAHARTKKPIRGAQLRRTVTEVLEWRPHWSRSQVARHCGYATRSAFEASLSATGEGRALLTRVWKDSEARFADPREAPCAS